MNRRYIDVNSLLDCLRSLSDELELQGLFNDHMATERVILLVKHRPVYNVCDTLMREGISQEGKHE